MLMGWRGGGLIQFGPRSLERSDTTHTCSNTQACAVVRCSWGDPEQPCGPMLQISSCGAGAQIKEANEVNSPPGLNPRPDISVRAMSVNLTLPAHVTHVPLSRRRRHAGAPHGCDSSRTHLSTHSLTTAKLPSPMTFPTVYLSEMVEAGR